MNLENQLTSLDLSRKLKELGVKQESLFCWTTENDLEFLPSEIRNNSVCIAAFSVAELGEMLPEFIENRKLILLKQTSIQLSHYYTITYIKMYEPIALQGQFKRFCEENESNARARMLIHLIENNLVTAEWRKQWLEK